MKKLMLAAVAALLCGGAAVAQSAPPTDDPYGWLEDIDGARSMAWVHAQNAKTAAVLEKDPRYETFRQEGLAIFTAKDRIPVPNFRGGSIDNFWQDETHKRGVWRRASVAGYGAAAPQWETVLDIDALAKAEGKDWYYKGAQCLEPEERYCLVRLSIGGKDAVSVREFDVQTKAWVPGGFSLPEGKQNVSWLDRDTLLVARDWGPGTLTESGYAYVLKSLKRGQSLDQAVEQYRSNPKEISVSPQVFRDANGKVDGVFFDRGVSFFEREYYVPAKSDVVVSACERRTPPCGPNFIRPTAWTKLPFPRKSNIQTYVNGQVLFTTEQDWNGFQAGDLLAYDLKALLADPANAKAVLVVRPKPNQSIEGVASTRDRLIVSGLEDVKGFVDAYDYKDGRWTAHRLDLPKDISVQIIDTSKSSNQLFLETQGLLSPTALWLADASNGSLKAAKTLPARFDASKDVVEQFWATSTDGTKIPYWLVRPKAMKADGSTPTIMYGYGGFQLSKPSVYLPEVGKIWLERGGAYVIADIRGGGEFGPKWHDAVLRENRQKAFDDYYAVANDLFKRGITSPRRLGIYGRSNGGVLMSVSMTQHPEMFHAVVVESPLVDMLRYNHLSAGASWVGEYGDPDKPEDRAFIAKYSGYQNLKSGVTYPKALITTNTKDDRVHPSHARKFAAKLEGLGDPYLYYEDNFGGHSYDADPTANAARWARHYTYLAEQLMD
ncbi:MAG: S9 family peptidase [Proteobacteria bacterium]|nr:S9 family peptidase [Pseudomonadota bacterium]